MGSIISEAVCTAAGLFRWYGREVSSESSPGLPSNIKLCHTEADRRTQELRWGLLPRIRIDRRSWKITMTEFERAIRHRDSSWDAVRHRRPVFFAAAGVHGGLAGAVEESGLRAKINHLRRSPHHTGDSCEEAYLRKPSASSPTGRARRSLSLLVEYLLPYGFGTGSYISVRVIRSGSRENLWLTAGRIRKSKFMQRTPPGKIRAGQKKTCSLWFIQRQSVNLLRFGWMLAK